MKQAAVMLIINPKGLVLSVSRRYDKTKFGLPGGKVDPGEEPWQAAVRETMEETSIITRDPKLIFERVEPPGTPDGKPFYTYAYYAPDWIGNPKNSEEGIVEWLTVADLIGTSGAFPEYNKLTFNAFKKLYPNIKLLGE